MTTTIRPEEIPRADSGGIPESVLGLSRYWFSQWHFVLSGAEATQRHGTPGEKYVQMDYVVRHDLGMPPKIVQIWFCAAELDAEGNPTGRIEGAHAVTAEGRIDVHSHDKDDVAKIVSALHNCIVHNATDKEMHIYTEWTKVGRGPADKDDWKTVGYYRVLLWA